MDNSSSPHWTPECFVFFFLLIIRGRWWRREGGHFLNMSKLKKKYFWRGKFEPFLWVEIQRLMSSDEQAVVEYTS